MDLITLAMWIIGIGIFVIQYLLGRYIKNVWPALIFPCAWIAAVIWFIYTGNFGSIRDWLTAPFGLLLLATAWEGGRQGAKKKLDEETKQIDNNPHPHA